MTQADRALLNEWCEKWLGAVPRRLMFERGHISRVIGARLSDGRPVVIKVRPFAPRISGCVAVQRHLFSTGFPCPEPLAGPAPLGGDIATAEVYVPGGVALTANGRVAALFAELLVDLLNRAPPLPAVPSLEPAPPWVGWNHEGPGTWPHPDDLDVDLNNDYGPHWIDQLGSRLRARLSGCATQSRIGHVDWESHNIRWEGTTPLAVDDWDSVAVLDERAIAGAAATVFPSSPDGRVIAATIDQTQIFLDAYQAARGVYWSTEEQEICWAAGLWVLAYNAKKESLGGGTGYISHLEREASERVRRAGA